MTYAIFPFFLLPSDSLETWRSRRSKPLIARARSKGRSKRIAQAGARVAQRAFGRLAKHFFNHTPCSADGANGMRHGNCIGVRRFAVCVYDFKAIYINRSGLNGRAATGSGREGVFINKSVGLLRAARRHRADAFEIILICRRAFDFVQSNVYFLPRTPFERYGSAVGARQKVFHVAAVCLRAERQRADNGKRKRNKSEKSQARWERIVHNTAASDKDGCTEKHSKEKRKIMISGMQ